MHEYLKPLYSNNKSFYKKANIEKYNHIIKLYSYNTLVSKIDTKKKEAIIYGSYSTTTTRHITEFLLQYNFKAVNRKQIEKDYMKEDLKC